MHFNLETPPNGLNSEAIFHSVKHKNLINNTVSVDKNDQNNILTSVLNNSKNNFFMVKINQILKPKKNMQSGVKSWPNNYSQDIQNIEEHYGICTSNNILVIYIIM